MTSWTDGPWVVYNGNVWAGGHPEVDGHSLIHTHRSSGGVGTTDWAHGHPVVTRREDAELIALAPDMAAAILAWDADPLSAIDLSKSLAQRLRLIGGQHD